MSYKAISESVLSSSLGCAGDSLHNLRLHPSFTETSQPPRCLPQIVTESVEDTL